MATGDDKSSASRQVRKRINEWQLAQERVARLERDLAVAIEEERDAGQRLCLLLAPPDAQPGERFGVWDRDRHDNEVLFQVLITEGGAASISIRGRTPSPRTPPAPANCPYVACPSPYLCKAGCKVSASERVHLAAVADEGSGP